MAQFIAEANFEFDRVEESSPVLEDREVKEYIVKWGLGASVKVYKYRFSQKLKIPEDLPSFIHSVIQSPLICAEVPGFQAFSITQDSEENGGTMQRGGVQTRLSNFNDLEMDYCVPIRSSLLTMDLFEKLKGSSIVAPDGSIKRCMDEEIDHFVVNDLLRRMIVRHPPLSIPDTKQDRPDESKDMLATGSKTVNEVEDDEDIDNDGLSFAAPRSSPSDFFTPPEQSEWLYHLFHLLVKGGGEFCQPEEALPPYLAVVKRLYKGTVSVAKSRQTGAVRVTSCAFMLHPDIRSRNTNTVLPAVPTAIPTAPMAKPAVETTETVVAGAVAGGDLDRGSSESSPAMVEKEEKENKEDNEAKFKNENEKEGSSGKDSSGEDSSGSGNRGSGNSGIASGSTGSGSSSSSSSGWSTEDRCYLTVDPYLKVISIVRKQQQVRMW